MSRADLEAFRAHVFGDAALALRLRDTEPSHFSAEALRVAGELGYDLTQDELQAAIADAQRRWMMRWVL
jgi:hypothetical protein